MVNHVLVRLQTNSQRDRIFCQQGAERVLMFLSVVRELPEFQGAERQRQTSRSSKCGFVITK
jgi:hypothetical protein